MVEPKLKHDEPMDTSEAPCEGNNGEEGEILSDDEEDVFWTHDTPQGSKILCDSESYGLPPSAILELKKLSRARRFGIPVEHGKTVLVDTRIMSCLYKSLGIDEENEKNYRFNAVHMRGTENMSTQDVYDYFNMYKPCYVEWINDVSCNVVWNDHLSAAKALLNLSKEIKNLDKIRFDANPFKKELESETMENYGTMETMETMKNVDADAVDARDIAGAIPPGYWRVGVPAKKSQTILLRLATRSDKKQKFAEKNSEYYKKYGNPHFGNIPGIVSNSLRSEVLRQYRQQIHNYGKYVTETERKNPWGRLAEEWGRQDEQAGAKCKIRLLKEEPLVRTDLRLSLNNKYADKPKTQMVSDSEPSKSENEKAKSKYPKMKMYADEEGKLKVSTVKAEKVPVGKPYVEDLRQRINRNRKRKQMMEEELKRKRMRYWGRRTGIKDGDNRGVEVDLHYFDGQAESEIIMGGVKGFDRYYDPDNDDSDDDDSDDDTNDDDDDDNDDNGDEGDGKIDVDDDVEEDMDDEDEKNASWALENYSDLRETLSHGKKDENTSDADNREQSKPKVEDKVENDEVEEDVDMCNMDIGHRSPLQIEFENDDYFERGSP